MLTIRAMVSASFIRSDDAVLKGIENQDPQEAGGHDPIDGGVHLGVNASRRDARGPRSVPLLSQV